MEHTHEGEKETGENKCFAVVNCNIVLTARESWSLVPYIQTFSKVLVEVASKVVTYLKGKVFTGKMVS